MEMVLRVVLAVMQVVLMVVIMTLAVVLLVLRLLLEVQGMILVVPGVGSWGCSWRYGSSGPGDSSGGHWGAHRGPQVFL